MRGVPRSSGLPASGRPPAQPAAAQAATAEPVRAARQARAKPTKDYSLSIREDLAVFSTPDDPEQRPWDSSTADASRSESHRHASTSKPAPASRQPTGRPTGRTAIRAKPAVAEPGSRASRPRPDYNRFAAGAANKKRATAPVQQLEQVHLHAFWLICGLLDASG